MKLSDTILFRGMEEAEIAALLDCMGAAERSYKKGQTMLSEGDVTDSCGIVLSGRAIISCNDVWGNCSVLGDVSAGGVFAEVYAALSGQKMLVTVSAAEDTVALFLNAGRIFSTCPKACPFHAALVRNMVSVMARKSLKLSQRMLHISSKTIRGRLMSYFSECAKRAGGNMFVIPYNRQQLADYLNVDRSAMCSELSRMGREGLLEDCGNSVKLLL